MKKIRLLIFYSFTAWFFCLFVSCNSQDKIKQLEKENASKESEIQQQKQQIDKLEQRLSALEQNDNYTSNENYPPSSNGNSGGSKQYYFIVLKVVEDHITNKESMYYTTSVNEIYNYDEVVKYQLLDKVVSNYKNSPSGMAWKGNVKDRQIYLFDNYAEASKAREKYIMN